MHRPGEFAGEPMKQHFTMDDTLKAHFLSLYCMVMADGIVSAKELETLYRIGRENYGLSTEEINKAIVSSGTSFLVPEEAEEKVRILYEMAEIAWADGDIDPTERNLLRRYATRLGFMEENAEAIADFMLQQVKEGKSFEEVKQAIVQP